MTIARVLELCSMSSTQEQKKSKELRNQIDVLYNEEWPLAIAGTARKYTDQKIMPSLQKAYDNACPAVASMKLAKWARRISNDDHFPDAALNDVECTAFNSSNVPSSETLGESKVIEADNDPKSACEAEEFCFEQSKHKKFVRHITVSA